MTPLRKRMLEDMQLRGLSVRTQQTYLSAIERLAAHLKKSPAILTDDVFDNDSNYTGVS